MARTRKSSVGSPNADKPKAPPSKPRPVRWSDPDDVWVGFLNARLDEDDWEAYEVWYTREFSQLQTMLEDLVASGAKLSVAYDDENEAWVASITGRLCLGLNGRCSASARGGTYSESVAVLLYKHYELAKQDWGQFNVKNSSFMKRG